MLPPRLYPRLRAALDASPLPVEFVHGKRHLRILIGGHQVLVISRGARRGNVTTDRCDAGHVRRFLERMKP